MSSTATRVVAGRGSAAGTASKKKILEQRNRIDIGFVDRQRQHRGIERAVLDVVDQLPGLGLAQFQPQLGKPRLQWGKIRGSK